MTPPANVATWPMQASLASKGDWQGLMKYNTHAAASRPAQEKPAAVTPAEPSDDLTQLNGIGPRIASILNDGGITSYNQLEHANTGELRQIIATGGALPPAKHRAPHLRPPAWRARKANARRSRACWATCRSRSAATTRSKG